MLGGFERKDGTTLWHFANRAPAQGLFSESLSFGEWKMDFFTACFAAIVLSMIVVTFIAVFQLTGRDAGLAFLPSG